MALFTINDMLFSCAIRYLILNCIEYRINNLHSSYNQLFKNYDDLISNILLNKKTVTVKTYIPNIITIHPRSLSNTSKYHQNLLVFHWTNKWPCKLQHYWQSEGLDPITPNPNLESIVTTLHTYICHKVFSKFWSRRQWL